MAESNMILDPYDPEMQAEEVRVENVHGNEVKVARPHGPDASGQQDLTDEKLRDQGVVLDSEGEYVVDELGNRVFVSYPGPESRAS
jgi:hypothetical protein